MNTAKKWWLLPFIAYLLVLGNTMNAQPSGKELIRQAIEAMGGLEKLENLKTVWMESVGHTNRLEQSERPEGPWLVSYNKTTTLLDFKKKCSKQEVELSFIGSEDWIKRKSVINGEYGMRIFGGRNIPMDRTSVKDAKAEWLLFPDRALLAAEKSNDVAFVETRELQGVLHHVIAYSYEGEEYLLFLNADTKLPTAVETEKSSYVDIWGQVPYRTYYSYWFMLPGGVPYPFQFDTYHGDQPFKTQSFTKIEFNVEIEDHEFAIPEKIKKASMQANARDWRSRPLGWQRESIKQIASDVVMIPGDWYTTIVKQSDGLVIIEAPISSEYSEKVIAEAGKRFPNIPIKAVINTSDAWPHLGGVRAYAARGIPIYTLDLNTKILSELIEVDYQLRPDSLQKHPTRPKFIEITGNTVLGKGANRLELYPIRGEGAERMVMVHFPEHQLLYGSDLIQYDRKGKIWNLQYASELKQAVEREGLNVEQVYAMHASPTAWDSIMIELNKFINSN